MKTARLTLAAAVAVLFAIFAVSSPAQAYPGVTVTVTDAELIGGNDVTITATVDPAVDCDWTFTYLGQTKTGTGSSITSTFHTPKVAKRTPTSSTATCTYDDTSGVSTSAIRTVTATGAGQVILLPLADDNGGSNGGDNNGAVGGGSGGGLTGLLPNTGGERLAWLVIGGLLVLVGGGAVMVSRHRV